MISMGGKSTYVSVFQKESYSKFKSEGWDVTAAASLSFAVFTGSASVDVSKHAADYHAFEEARSSTLKICVGAGGDCAPLSPDQNSSTWVNAVQDNPMPLVYELQDLPSLLTSGFFPDDPDIASRRQALTAFLTDHYCGENQACKPAVPSRDGYWGAVADVSCAGYAGQRREGAAAAGVGSRLFLSGGEGQGQGQGKDGTSAAVCAWSEDSNAWSPVPDMPTPRAHHAVVTLRDPFSAGDRTLLATGGRQLTGSQWTVDRALSGHTDAVRSMAISTDGRFIVSGSGDATVKVWSLASGDCLRTLTGHIAWVGSVAVSPDGRYIVSGSGDATIKVWSLATGECIRTLQETSEVWSVAVTPDGQSIISGNLDATVKVWSLASGEGLQTLTGHTAGVTSVAVSPDGQNIVSGSPEATVKVWSLRAGSASERSRATPRVSISWPSRRTGNPSSPAAMIGPSGCGR
jgi:WD40 repeat protein